MEVASVIQSVKFPSSHIGESAQFPSEHLCIKILYFINCFPNLHFTWKNNTNMMSA